MSKLSDIKPSEDVLKDNYLIEKRSKILNNDVLTRVLSEVETKNLFKLLRVSKQFEDCIGIVLRHKKRLDIGGSDYHCLHMSLTDRTHLICMKDNIEITPVFRNPVISQKDYYNMILVILHNRNPKTPITSDSFKTILKKCPRIQCVHLKDYIVDREMLKVLSKNLLELNCLYLETCKTFGENKWNRYLPKRLKRLLINKTYSEDEDRNKIRKKLEFIKDFEFLEKFSMLSHSGLTDDMDLFDQIVVEMLPNSLICLSLRRNQSQRSYRLENLININQFRSLRDLDICCHRITTQFLSDINQTFDLISFKFQCKNLNWISICQLAKKQKNLKILAIYYTILENICFDRKRCVIFNRVKSLELYNFFVCSTVEEYQHFLRMFPNLRTLDHTISGVVCEDKDQYSDKCQTCYNLTFNSFVKQMSSLITLKISEEDIQTYLDYLFSSEITLNRLVIYYRSNNNVEDIEWRIEMIVMAFIQLSLNCPTKLFQLEFHLLHTYLDNLPVVPKNLLIKIN